MNKEYNIFFENVPEYLICKYPIMLDSTIATNNKEISKKDKVSGPGVKTVVLKELRNDIAIVITIIFE